MKIDWASDARARRTAESLRGALRREAWLAEREARRTRHPRHNGVDRPRGEILAALTLTGALTATFAVALAVSPEPRPQTTEATAVRAARRLNRAAGTLAGSVLFDSALEHYAAAFKNKAMITPLVTASASLWASLHGHTDRAHGSHRLRDAAYAAAGAAGIAGTLFHIYNVTKRPGGICFQNLFYGAPLGAPMALVLSGLMGFLSERVRDNLPRRDPKILGIPAGRAVAAMGGIGLLGTAAEAGLLHLRGAYHNPAMVLPVTVPPLAGVLLARTAFQPAARHPGTRLALRLTALLGLAGAAFHSIGVARNMGGWRNWSQNLLAGPPIPAPPSFTGVALAGLAALGLQQEAHNG